jgi:hypothetical protein
MNKQRNSRNINWPSSSNYFTFEELAALNPDVNLATLRVDLKNAITESKKVVVIGNITGNKGRPKLIHAMAPVIQDVVDKARENDNIIINESKLIEVLDIKSSDEVTELTETANLVQKNESITA